MYQLGWFSTGRGEGSKGLLRAVQQAIASGEIKTRLEFVFCSREQGETEATDGYLKMVKDYGIPLVSLSYRRFKAGRPDNDAQGALSPWRLEYDREAMRRLQPFHPDLCVLAGYMLIVGPEMCQRYDMINLHPAAPGGPVGTWQEVIWQLIARGASETGVMMHLVIPELDRGPVATYCTFPIRGGAFDRHWAANEGKSVDQIKKTEGENNPLFRLIRQHGYTRELPLVVATIQAFSQGKVKIGQKRVVDATGRPIPGYDLTGEINARIKGQLPD